MQSTLDGDKYFGEESSGRNRGRSGIDGDAFVNRVMIDGLTEKTLDQRFDAREGVNNCDFLEQESKEAREGTSAKAPNVGRITKRPVHLEQRTRNI